MINSVNIKEKMVKVFVLYNPAAGLAINNYLLTSIKTYIRKQSEEYELFIVTGQESIRELIKEKVQQGFNKFIAAGGDGTVSLLADGLSETGMPFAILPMGTGNLIARELQIPLNPVKALQLAFSNNATTSKLDGMLVNDNRLFFLNVSIGFSAELMHEMQKQKKKLFGRLSYVVHFLKLSFTLLRNCIVFDVDEIHRSIHATEAILSNGKILGFPAFHWKEPSRLDDGKISFHVLEAFTMKDIIRFAISLSPLKLHDNRTIVYYDEIEDTISITGKKRLKVQADGDFISYTPINVKIVRHACEIIVPSKHQST